MRVRGVMARSSKLYAVAGIERGLPRDHPHSCTHRIGFGGIDIGFVV
jgi:hypothetical protein